MLTQNYHYKKTMRLKNGYAWEMGYYRELASRVSKVLKKIFKLVFVKKHKGKLTFRKHKRDLNIQNAVIRFQNFAGRISLSFSSEDFGITIFYLSYFCSWQSKTLTVYKIEFEILKTLRDLTHKIYGTLETKLCYPPIWYTHFLPRLTFDSLDHIYLHSCVEVPQNFVLALNLVEIFEFSKF